MIESTHFENGPRQSDPPAREEIEPSGPFGGASDELGRLEDALQSTLMRAAREPRQPFRTTTTTGRVKVIRNDARQTSLKSTSESPSRDGDPSRRGRRYQSSARDGIRPQVSARPDRIVRERVCLSGGFRPPERQQSSPKVIAQVGGSCRKWS